MRTTNNILRTDVYKLGHHDMLPLGTKRSHMHMMARLGPGIPFTVWFGLQYYLQRYLSGQFATREMLEEARQVGIFNLGHDVLNYAGWMRIINVHGGRLPLEIRAVPEGLRVPRGNVLMTMENTDDHLAGLPGHLESLLMKVYAPTTVATRSTYGYERMLELCRATGTDPTWAQFMIHDFGYRGDATEEGAEMNGAAHLVGSRGTDTLVALPWLRDYYGAPLEGLGLSVQASQHEIMTAEGRLGEHSVVRRLVAENAGRTLSLVGDSYDYHAFVDFIISEHEFIQAKRVNLVIRPDSTTPQCATKADVVAWTLQRQAEKLAEHVTTTSTGHKVVPFKVLYGDGHDGPDSVVDMVQEGAVDKGFAAGNVLGGMGAGVHQKFDRDTLRFAIKSSAQLRDGTWHDVSKEPLDVSKRSHAGRLELYRSRVSGEFRTARIDHAELSATQEWEPMLRPVFRNGVVLRQQTFDEIRRLV